MRFKAPERACGAVCVPARRYKLVRKQSGMRGKLHDVFDAVGSHDNANADAAQAVKRFL